MYFEIVIFEIFLRKGFWESNIYFLNIRKFENINDCIIIKIYGVFYKSK